ncbi:MAG: antitoxin [Rhizobiales bacterium 65-9]|nr:type II toxin-antitoxin system ParD family antitoxin [Hyphomicrobiales bacterium]OJY32854.1 MAG: antitoxin [Rhizobiales bacterium 65-9]
MPKNTSIILSERLADFVDEQVSEGRFASASEVVRAGLRLLEQENLKLKALRAALEEGEASGVATGFDFDRFLTEKRKSAS